MMKIKKIKYILIFLLLCTHVANGQQKYENFAGHWRNDTAELNIIYSGKGVCCTYYSNNDTLETNNVAIVGGKMYIDFSKETDGCRFVVGESDNSIPEDFHLIFTCVFTKGQLKVTKHTISNNKLGVKSQKSCYRRAVRIRENKSYGNDLAIRNVDFFDKIPADSIKTNLARQIKLIVNDSRSDYLSDFVRYCNIISLMESKHSSLKTDSVLMRRYSESLYARALIYRFFLADTANYVSDLRKINEIKHYSEILQNLATVDAERQLPQAKTQYDTVRILERLVKDYLLNINCEHLCGYQLYMGNKESWGIDSPIEDSWGISVLTTQILRLHWKAVWSSEFTPDSLYHFFLRNPQTLYLGNVDCAVVTMNSLMYDYSNAIAFYENIRQNFPFNDKLNSLYVGALIQGGYADEAIRELLRRSLATAPDDSLHQMVLAQMVERYINAGHMWDIAEEIEDNVNGFAYYVNLPVSNVYSYLALYNYYKKDYQKASENIQAFFNHEQDSSRMMLLQADVLSRMAEEEQSILQRDIQFQDAENCYNAVINYEDRRGIVRYKPLAYLGQNKNYKAIDEIEKILEKDTLSSEDYFVAAQVFAQVGNTANAIWAITESLERNNDRNTREKMLREPYLEPVRNTIKRLCAPYKKYDIIQDKLWGLKYHRVFDTLTTIVPFSSSRNGTIFLKECRISNIELNGLIFDPGAEISQISRALVDKLLKQGTIRPEDCLGPLTTEVADGKKQVNGMVYRIPSFEIGTINLKNVHAFVPDNPPNVPLLLGENAFGDMIVTINPRKLTLSFTQIVERKKQ